MEVLQNTYKDTKIGMIPKDWEILKLGELCETITKGTTPTTNGYSYLNEGINFVKVESIDAFGTFKKKMFAHIGEDCYESFKRSQLKEGDILISIAGALGRTAIVTNDILPANTNQAVGILRLKDKSLNTFIRYFLDSYFLQKFIERINVASAQANLNLGHLDKFNIVFPPLPEQQKIAAILSTVDEQISTTDKIIEKSKDLKKGLMQKLFSEGIGHTEFKDTKIGRIPKDWNLKKLVEIASFRRGSFPQPYGLAKWYDDENGHPFIQVYDVGKQMKLKPTTKRKISDAAAEKSVFVAKGTLILTIQGSIGRVAITQYDAYIDRTLLIFQSFLLPTDKIYLSSQLEVLFNKERQKANGSTILTITKAQLSNFLIPLPPLPEQQKIAAILSEADAKIEKEQTQKAHLQALKKGLMQQLLTGKKRVKV
jgi:type I restriction enzyme, S subunit